MLHCDMVRTGKVLYYSSSRRFAGFDVPTRATVVVDGVLLSLPKTYTRPELRRLSEAMKKRYEKAMFGGPCPRGSAFTYVIQEEGENGFIKIGTANDPEARVLEFQTGNPRKLTILAMWSSTVCPERALQLFFQSARLRGEWFSPTPELLAFIEGMREHYRARLAVAG